MKRNLKFVLIFLCFGCGSAKVIYDYDPKSNFDEYKTYLFFSDAGDGLSRLDVKRFKRAITSELDTLGIKTADVPDFYVNVIVEKTEVNQNSVGFDFIGGGRNYGIGMSTGTTVGSKRVGEKITIDFVDAKTNALFWQGSILAIVRERLKPPERVAYVQKIIDKILSGYPPK